MAAPVLKRFLVLLLSVLVSQQGYAKRPGINYAERLFINGYEKFNLPVTEYDYRSYFASIPPADQLRQQQSFFIQLDSVLGVVDSSGLTSRQRLHLETMRYEAAFNLQRLELELSWVEAGRKTPLNGLHDLPDAAGWYSLFIRRFTSTHASPEEVFEMGKREVARVYREIQRIRQQLGYNGDSAFYAHLSSPAFRLTSGKEIVRRFQSVDSVVRRHLSGFVGGSAIPKVHPMEWPDADANTPPGMYLNHANNAYGRDVFLYNFFGGRYNSRVIEWLYMHEAIPGHHLQSTLRPADPLLDMLLYPGNFEGWACYVEYYGTELGLYRDVYSELGKWEWDLVRSARLVIDAGIHYYGWSHAEALAYWKANIPGQDDIAEREVTRVTRWPAQALSYKVGADAIFHMQEEWKKRHPSASLADFRKQYLGYGMAPLEVIQRLL